jgi:hypothetical protein
VSLSVWALRGKKWQERFAGEPVKRTALLWPLELGVLAKGDDDVRFDVVASAFDADGKLLVFDRAVARFSRDDTRVLELRLHTACMTAAPCAEPTACQGETCLVCVPAGDAQSCLPAGERKTSTYAPVSHGFTEAMAVDAAVDQDDGAVPDAGPRDAGYLRECTPDASTLAEGSCGQGMRCAGKPGARRCEDIDECTNEPGLCAPGTCENTEGAFVCRCPDDYEGTQSCTLVGHCEDDNICTPGRCTFEGPDLCWCFEGFVSTSEGCLDIDECATGVCGERPCRNVPGSYLCQCPGSDVWCDPEQPCRGSGEDTFCQGELADWFVPGRVPGAAHPAQDEELPDDIVHDLVTGLYWFKESYLFWPDALEFCRTLDIGGRDDWRLPSAVELMSRADYQGCPPCRLLTDPFAEEVWTSQRIAPYEDALYLKLGNGELSRDWIMYRREGYCVSGEPTRGTARNKRYVEQDAGALLLDTQTELAWQRSSVTTSWQEAVSTCAALSLGGHDDYRLPTPQELYTLVDFRSETHLPPELALASESRGAWTSQAMGQRLAMALTFQTGVLESTETERKLEARCVRTGP